MAGLLLALPSLTSGLVLDDLVQQRQLQVDGGHPSLATGLFTFATGVPAENQRLVDAGDLLPWWSDPELKVKFFRPLTTATHVVDAWLWPRSPVLMHLHSLLDYGLLLLLVSTLYTRLWGRGPLALLALLLYVVDDSHGVTLSWLANRNAILTTLLGVVTLLAHHAWRSDPDRRGSVLALLASPALLVMGFLTGEGALATLGYLVAYALFVDPARPLRRALSLLPTVLVAAVWQVGYRAFDFGVRHSGIYRDPAHAPLEFARGLLENGVALVGSQVGGAPADLAAWGTPPYLQVGLIISALLCAGVIVAASPVLRARPLARFWALGAVLAAAPVCASVPGDRLLLFVSVGMMGFLAELFSWYARQWRARERSARLAPLPPRPSARVARRGAAAGLAFVGALVLRRTLVAAILLPMRTHSMDSLAIAADDAESAIDRFGPGADTVIFVDVPASPVVSYLASRRALNRRPNPSQIRWLVDSRYAVEVTRGGADTLRVAPAGGFLSTPCERLYRDDRRPFAVGQTVHLAGMTASIASLTDDRRPASVDFAFDGPLDRPGRLWLTWRGDHFERFALPRQGEGVSLPATDLLAVVHGFAGRRPAPQPESGPVQLGRLAHLAHPLDPAPPPAGIPPARVDSPGQLFPGSGESRDDPATRPRPFNADQHDRTYLRAGSLPPPTPGAPHQSATLSVAHRGR